MSSEENPSSIEENPFPPTNLPSPLGQDPNKNDEMLQLVTQFRRLAIQGEQAPNRNALLQQDQHQQANPSEMRSPAGQLSDLMRPVLQPTPPPANEAKYGTDEDVKNLLDDFLKFYSKPNLGHCVPVYNNDKSVMLNAFADPDKINIQNGRYTEGNNYQIGGIAGKGAFGTVYNISDNISNIKFVKKIIKLTGNNYTKALSSIRREVEALLWCNSEFIVKLIGIRVYQTDNYIYPQIDIYLEYGCSLKMHLTRNVPEPLEMLKIILQVLHGIDYLHQRNHAHTDLHAGNILIDDDGQVKLCDLGSVKSYDEYLFTQSDGNNAAYLPPTVLKKWLINNKNGSVQENIRVSGRLDTFALGKILLEAVTGRINSLISVDEMIKYIGDKNSWESFVLSFFPKVLPPYRTDDIQWLIENLTSFNPTIGAGEAIDYLST